MANKEKLIIHETDPHGCGTVTYNGTTHYYAYDDEMGDIKSAIDELISLGFISKDDVVILHDKEIYHCVEEYLKNASEDDILELQKRKG